MILHAYQNYVLFITNLWNHDIINTLVYSEVSIIITSTGTRGNPSSNGIGMEDFFILLARLWDKDGHSTPHPINMWTEILDLYIG